MSQTDSESEIEFEDGSEFSFDDDSDGFDGVDNDDTNSLEYPNTEGNGSFSQNVIKTHAVEYKCTSLHDFVYLEFISIANTISQQLVNVSFEDILVMLHYCRWQQEEVIDNFYDNHEKLYEGCGLGSTAQKSSIKTKQDFSCMICCEDYESVQTYALACGHEYCVNCYGEYCRNEVGSGHLVRCMDTSCTLTIPHDTVQQLYDSVPRRKEASVDPFSGEPFSTAKGAMDENYDYVKPVFPNSIVEVRENERYSHNILLKYAAKAYITGKRSNFKWCPAPDCDGLVEVLNKVDDTNSANNTMSSFGTVDGAGFDINLDINSIPMVTCPDDHGFCYDCQKEDHLPCPCGMVKMWIKKCNDDSETANWIDANTHSCPKCYASIEKNGGCNHMTCSTCRFEFCWICLKEWAIHGTEYYKCSKFEQNIKDELMHNQRKKRETLQRYLHYYKRFSLHESSMKGDSKTLGIVNQRMATFMEEQSKSNKDILSWIDIQFLQDACKALTNGRKTLKWTYCLSYYLQGSTYADVFEQLQEYLNKVVEDLSKIFEQILSKKQMDRSTEIIMKERRNIINLSSLVTKRQKTLIECAASGLKDGLLKVTTR